MCLFFQSNVRCHCTALNKGLIKILWHHVWTKVSIKLCCSAPFWSITAKHAKLRGGKACGKTSDPLAASQWNLLFDSTGVDLLVFDCLREWKKMPESKHQWLHIQSHVVTI